MGITKDQRQLHKDFVRKLKEETPCADCGAMHPWVVMDFDHRERADKSANVSDLISKGSSKALMQEILKCDVVCSNCHRIREFERDQRV